MASKHDTSTPGYAAFRRIFSGLTGCMWFVLFLGLVCLIASKLPKSDAIPLQYAVFFIPAALMPVFFFGAPGMLMSFMQAFSDGKFRLPSGTDQNESSDMSSGSNNPWLLGVHRMLVFWPVASLLGVSALWWLRPDTVSFAFLAVFVALLAGLLAGANAYLSAGKPFIRAINRLSRQNRWTGSYPEYLLWRHGIPWGLSNCILNAIVAVPLFPIDPDGPADVASAFMVSVDTFFTGLILCFFMAISAHPHAQVDFRMGLIKVPSNARSPGKPGRIACFVFASFLIALGTWLVLMAVSNDQITLPGFVVWKAVVATLIAGVAAMVTAHWTIARESTSETKLFPGAPNEPPGPN